MDTYWKRLSEKECKVEGDTNRYVQLLVFFYNLLLFSWALLGITRRRPHISSTSTSSRKELQATRRWVMRNWWITRVTVHEEAPSHCKQEHWLLCHESERSRLGRNLVWHLQIVKVDECFQPHPVRWTRENDQQGFQSEESIKLTTNGWRPREVERSVADIVKCGCCRVIETKEGRDKGTFISKIPKAGSDPKNLQTNIGYLDSLVSTETFPPTMRHCTAK